MHVLVNLNNLTPHPALCSQAVLFLKTQSTQSQTDLLLLNTHLLSPFILSNHSLLFLSSFFLIWSTSESIPELQTSEWRHQVVPTVVRPNVRRPIAPSPVAAPSSPSSSSPFILPSPSSIHTQTSTITSISVPSSDSLTGIHAVCWPG